tara:strand:- start:2491 stop:2799 length:309 start_codon:yes stop_codon:yes gene_type:complete
LYKLNSHSSSIIKQACELDVEIVVKKVFKNITYQGSNLWYQLEKRALLAMHAQKPFPKLLAVDDDNFILFTNYCGESITKEKTVPINWRDQLTEIITILNKQ